MKSWKREKITFGWESASLEDLMIILKLIHPDSYANDNLTNAQMHALWIKPMINSYASVYYAWPYKKYWNQKYGINK